MKFSMVATTPSNPTKLPKKKKVHGLREHVKNSKHKYQSIYDMFL